MLRNQLLFVLFFVSGFCGLLYQIIWLRLAFASFGILTSVLSIVISGFMLGLAIGSWAGGKWITPFTRRTGISAIYVYAFFEAMIGVGALVVPVLFGWGEDVLLDVGEMDSRAYLVFSALLVGGAILPWCIFMGTTFPVMMAYLREDGSEHEGSFGFLYLANVLGALGGTAVTVLVLVELFGFRNTLLLAAAGNFGIAIAGVLIGRVARQPAGRRQVAASDRTSADDEGAAAAPQASSQRIASIIFMTGFTSMALEVIWVRAYAPILKNQVYSFAAVLFAYLLATALGSAWYRRHRKRSRALSVSVLLGFLSVTAFLPIVLNDPRLHWSAVAVCASIFPFCAGLGYLTPLLIDSYSQGHPRRGGFAYALNVIGCIIGPLVASYALLPWLGSQASMIVMSLPFVVYFLSTSDRTDRSRQWFLPVASGTGALVLLALLVSRNPEDRWASGDAQLYRDHTATVIARRFGDNHQLIVNGVHQGAKVDTFRVHAHLPMGMRPAQPKSALTICFGMGVTYRSLLSWGQETTAVELVPSVVESFRFFWSDADRVLANPQGRIVIDDGRRFLRRITDRFDVITIDAPEPPEAAGSSLLFSDEFYALVKRRLHQEGVMQQFYRGGEAKLLQAIDTSIRSQFPHVKVFASISGTGYHFIASQAPLRTPTVSEFIDRMPAAAREDLIAAADRPARPGDLPAKVAAMLAVELQPDELPRQAPAVRVTIDRPFNEFFALRRFFGWYDEVPSPPVVRGLRRPEQQVMLERLAAARRTLPRYLAGTDGQLPQVEALRNALANWSADTAPDRPSREQLATELDALVGDHLKKKLGCNWVLLQNDGETGQILVRHNASGQMFDPYQAILESIESGDAERIVNAVNDFIQRTRSNDALR
ncbi:MAG: spermidine synthase [Planctomycetota bacterium]|nr:MAG: spermidine synthase [Planctomycetota bacterium]REK48098.1 MAG: spermidine synthase [Planctomycetota bacterium]